MFLLTPIIDGRMIIGMSGASTWHSIHTDAMIILFFSNYRLNFQKLLLVTVLKCPLFLHITEYGLNRKNPDTYYIIFTTIHIYIIFTKNLLVNFNVTFQYC